MQKTYHPKDQQEQSKIQFKDNYSNKASNQIMP